MFYRYPIQSCYTPGYIRAMKRPADSRSPPPLTPPPSKRKCLQTTPPTVIATNGDSMELDITNSLQTNGSSRRTNGRSSQSSRSSTASSPPSSPSRRGRGRSSTPSASEPEPPGTPTRRSTRIRKHNLFSPTHHPNYVMITFITSYSLCSKYSCKSEV